MTSGMPSHMLVNQKRRNLRSETHLAFSSAYDSGVNANYSVRNVGDFNIMEPLKDCFHRKQKIERKKSVPSPFAFSKRVGSRIEVKRINTQSPIVMKTAPHLQPNFKQQVTKSSCQKAGSLIYDPQQENLNHLRGLFIQPKVSKKILKIQK